MPPKAKITKEAIIQASLDIIRRDGDTALNARSLAAALHCSTQPIFSNFSAMEQLRQEVVTAAEGLFRTCMEQETQTGEFPPYKASGMAYIRFAKEEKALFKLLFMRDRTAENIPAETDIGDQMQSLVQGNTGLDEGEAKLFHLEMWAYVHGIAVMHATGFLELDRELTSRMLTDAYQGLTKQFAKE